MRVNDMIVKVLRPNTDIQFTLSPFKIDLNLQGRNVSGTANIFINRGDYIASGGVLFSDDIEVYYKIDDANDYSFLCNLIVKDVKLDSSLDTINYVISCCDYTNFVLSFLSSKQQIQKTFIECIQFFLFELNSQNKESGKKEITLVEYPIKTSAGLPFDKFDYYAFQRPLNEVLNELCSEQYTKDGTYAWWIDGNNGLHIVKDTKFSSYDLSGIIVKNFNYGYGRDQVINQFIIYLGKDFNDVPMYTMVFDAPSIAMYGLSYSIIPLESVRNEIYGIYKNTISNNEFVSKCKELGTAKGRELLRSKGTPIEKVSISTYALPITLNVKCTLPSFISHTKELIVSQITHNYDKGGWLTKIDFTERDGLKYGK